jgi:glycosyltransferase involved in cell wall biosynthesis
MKILHFTHSFFPEFGGTSTRHYNLLSDNANEHFLYVKMPEKIHNLRDSYGNIKVRRCRFINYDDFRFKIPLRNTLKYIKINSNKLLNLVNEKEIDIVHGHNPLQFSIAAMKYSKWYNLPFVYEVHMFNYNQPTFKKNRYVPKSIYYLESKLLKLKVRKIYNQANAIIVQSNDVKQRIIKLLNIEDNKITVIPMGIDEIMFSSEKWHQKAIELKQKNNWDDKIVFMYNGYLDTINGIELFLNVINELPYKIKKKIKIILLGRGPLRDYVEKMSRKMNDLIKFLGLLDYKEMPIYYGASDVIVTPRLLRQYIKYNVPTKLLEAMAMEKIVLASDLEGIKEIIKDNKNGFTFHQGNNESLLNKICYIVENFDGMSNIRKQARNDVIEKYRWKDMRTLLNKVYSNVIN